MPGIPPDCDRLAKKLALLHIKLFPRPFSNHATECSGIVGEGTSVGRFKSVPTSVIADRLAHARQTRVSSPRDPAGPIQPEYPVLFSMFSVEFCLWSKSYLVVKIASVVLTEHCCQVCVLAMMFCRSDCRLCAGMCGKWLRNQEISRTSVPRVLDCWHSDRPTCDMKNILYISFFTFYLNRDTSVLELFPVVVFQ